MQPKRRVPEYVLQLYSSHSVGSVLNQTVFCKFLGGVLRLQKVCSQVGVRLVCMKLASFFGYISLFSLSCLLALPVYKMY